MLLYAESSIGLLLFKCRGIFYALSPAKERICKPVFPGRFHPPGMDVTLRHIFLLSLMNDLTLYFFFALTSRMMISSESGR